MYTGRRPRWLTSSNGKPGARILSACQVAYVKCFTTFGNVGKQDVDKWVLAIERCPPLIFYSDDPLDSRKIELA
jgi:hypothetical protein